MLKWAEICYRVISAPLPFNVLTGDLPRIPRSKNKGINIGKNKINSLIYADDIVLISKSQQLLQRRLDICERHSHRTLEYLSEGTHLFTLRNWSFSAEPDYFCPPTARFEAATI